MKHPHPQEVFYYELSNAHAILKAQQVMRDYQRPDRMAAARVRRFQALDRSCDEPPPGAAADAGGLPRHHEDDEVRTTFQLLAEQQQQQTASALEVERAIANANGNVPSDPPPSARGGGEETE